MASTESSPDPARADHYIDPATAGTAAPHFALGATRSHPVPFELREFPAPDASGTLPLKHAGDVELEVAIELGRAEMAASDVARLQPGMVVALDALAGDLVDVVVGGRLVARGEVVVVDERICVRVVEWVAGRQAA